MNFPLYSILYGAAMVTAAPYYLIHGRKSGKYAWNLAARLGWDPPLLPPKTRPRIWVHALSLGEVQSAVELVKALATEGFDLCWSTTTRTGYDAAAKRLPDIPRFSLPLDLPSAITRTIDAVQPDLLVLIETDLWPNLLAGLANRFIPTILLNARLSPRSFRGYSFIKGLWGRVLNLLTIIACQTEADREKFLALGAKSQSVRVTGNLKFDRSVPETGPEVRRRMLMETGLPDGTWLVAGSTHQGEEEVLLSIFEALRHSFSELHLLIAPRDQGRFDSVWRLIHHRNIIAGRRTASPPPDDCQVFLLDTFGELDRFYEIADVVFVGKSLAGAGEGGGQNLLEPALRSKPVLFGPLMHNFAQVAQLMIHNGGGRQVQDAADLESVLEQLLLNPDIRQDMGRRAAAGLELHRGAIKANVELINNIMAR